MASWHVDLLKYDFCGKRPSNVTAEEVYRRMAQALHEAGRPVVLLACSWGQGEPSKWVREVGALARAGATVHPEDGAALAAPSWRTGTDLWAVFDQQQQCERGVAAVYNSIASTSDCYADARACGAGLSPGADRLPGVGDPDMLVAGMDAMTVDESAGVVGRPGASTAPLSPDESTAHVRLWAMWSAPLIISVDVREQWRARAYQSRALVYIDQHGAPATRLRQLRGTPAGLTGDVGTPQPRCAGARAPAVMDVWRKRLDSATAVLLFVNRAPFAIAPTLLLSDLPPDWCPREGAGRAMPSHIASQVLDDPPLALATAKVLKNLSEALAAPPAAPGEQPPAVRLPPVRKHASLWLALSVVKGEWFAWAHT